jgi:hypothetical protein
MPAARHPVDDIATLVRAAAGVNVKIPGGTELNFDPKSIAKAE